MRKSIFAAGSSLLPAALLLFSGPLAAGSVKGKVTITKEFEKYYDEQAQKGIEGDTGTDYYWLIENGILPIKPAALDPSRLVIAVMKTGGSPPPSGIFTVSLGGAMSSPNPVIVPPKSTVKFVNNDPFVHSLFCAEMGQVFAPEITPSRQTRQIPFFNEGVYDVGCKITPHLHAWVIVTPLVVQTAAAQKDGSFAVEGLPAGTYDLKVYHGEKVLGSRKIEVTDAAPAELEVPIYPPGFVPEKKACQGGVGCQTDKPDEKGKGDAKKDAPAKGKGKAAAPKNEQ